MDGLRDRFLNVSLLPGSQAHLAYYAQVNFSLPGSARPAPTRPALQLHFFGGKTIADLVYVNRYLGGAMGHRGGRPVNAWWFAAWTTGSRLSPVRPRPAGPAKGPALLVPNFPDRPIFAPGEIGWWCQHNCGWQEVIASGKQGIAKGNKA